MGAIALSRFRDERRSGLQSPAMSDDLELDQDLAKDVPAAPKKKTLAPGVASSSAARETAPLVLRIVLGTAGLCLVVGFFFPWIKIGDLANISGLDLAISDNIVIRQAIGASTRWVLLAVPVLGLALTAIGYLGFKWSGLVGVIVGVLVVGYGIFILAYLFFQLTAPGLWIVLVGALAAFFTGLVTVLRARRGKTGGDVTRAKAS
jgi:hypothetical protein